MVSPRSVADNLFRYVFAVSWRHQIALVALTVITFLLEIVPLEIQRRVVNTLVKERPFQLVIALCAAYAGAVLIQGATKLGLNVYRGWVGENATRDLRRHVIGYSRTAQAVGLGPEARGIGAAMIVAEVEPIGGFVGSSLSEPLLQAGILLSVLAYIVHLDRWMAAAALAFFLPQLVFVPLMQGAINRRANARGFGCCGSSGSALWRGAPPRPSNRARTRSGSIVCCGSIWEYSSSNFR
jgi:ABC-type multidrug transport system fused ATPase/permease subunit